MDSPGLSSCSQCLRPLALDSGSGLCGVCLVTAATVDTSRGASGATRTGVPTSQPALPRDASTLPVDAATRTPAPAFADETAEAPFVSRLGSLPAPPPGYDLLQLLGTGGMGCVYLAREHVAERVVAIKFLSTPSVTAVFNRFLVEVRSQVKLRHPRIIEVIAADANGREPYFTMEYASEGSLADWAKPDRLLPPPEAARLVMQAAEGIAFAHSRNVLHRDIKPSNILLAPSENGGVAAKVSDFGLAKRTDVDDGLTNSGALGTASYMSPEAAAGKHREIGVATDVYGLGAALYHLLTGRPPFQGNDSLETMRKVLAEPVQLPRSVNSAVPAGLEAVVMKALEKSPANRYSTAEAFAADLQRWLVGEAPAAPVFSRRRRAARWIGRQRMRIATAGALALAAAGLVAATNHFRPQPAAPVQSDPAAEHLAAVRAKLRAGEPVELIGAKGLPKYHRFWLEQAVLQEEPNGTCSFRAFSTSMCELVPPDLGVEHYEVSLELQHLRASIPGPAKMVDVDSIAFYMSHGIGRVEKKTVHAALALLYKDFEMPAGPNVPRTRGASLTLTGFVEDPDARDPVESVPPIRVAAVPFAPTSNVGAARAMAGEWRRIVVEVGPSGLVVQWRADKVNPNEPEKMIPVSRWSRDETAAQFAKGLETVNKVAPGAAAALPGWRPDLACGVRATKSAVAIRNVRITPLPKTL